MENKLKPGESVRATKDEAKVIIRRNAGTISVRTCFGYSVKITKKQAYALLSAIIDDTVRIKRGDNANYSFLFMSE